ncbi:MAG: MoaD/ThiS family protein [Anaerolineaceae bacterium]|nr:MoaD/ThiS family protein [Anaerolineaceae bacterium]
MIVKVKLFASLRDYYPDVKLGESFDVHLEPGATISQLYERLGIPEEQIKITFVNGLHGEPEDKLSANDEVGIFPPIGGG